MRSLRGPALSASPPQALSLPDEGKMIFELSALSSDTSKVATVGAPALALLAVILDLVLL